MKDQDDVCPREFCQEHSGLLAQMAGLGATLIEVWKQLNGLKDELAQRWPIGATIAVSVLTCIIGAMGGAFAMYVHMVGK